MYYPDQRLVSKMTAIHRECLLPEEAIGTVRVAEGQLVEIRDVVARGMIPARHVIINAAEILRLRKRDYEKLEIDLLLVNYREQVGVDEPIAGKHRDRGRRVFSPVSGFVVLVEDGRIIMQEMPDIVNLEAGVRGDVVQVYEGRGVAIEATGALVQGVWGNGRNLISTLRLEPSQGITSVSREELDVSYRNVVVITSKTLTEAQLNMAEERGFAGLIAPSMDASLVERALASEVAILLTEGFGDMNMSNDVYRLLQDLEGRNVTLDAYLPRRWEPRRPEVVINIPTREKPERLDLRLALRRNMRVRLTRPPYLGELGRVVRLPSSPQRLDNGLRVMCAEVELADGTIVLIPLANLELAGR